MKLFGIDLSTWNDHYPYAKATASGVKFAILRAGFSQTKDNQFENHYKAAKEQGWGIGAYWYMYATTIDGAKKEAQAFLNTVKGKQFDYPLYLDFEDPSILKKTDKATRTAMANAFCQIVEDAGYYVGIYTNLNWYKNLISGATLNKRWDWWIAYWGSSQPTGIDYGIWQYNVATFVGQQTDLDYCYKDYPTIIKAKGLNGFPKESPTPKPEPTPAPTPIKTVDELAQEVLDGKWGNGEDRYNRLTAAGYNYDAVQNKVNQILAEKNKELKVGDNVQIIDYGNSQANGKGWTAYGIGYRMKVLKIYKNYAFPYQVGNNGGTTGFYKASALKKI